MPGGQAKAGLAMARQPCPDSPDEVRCTGVFNGRTNEEKG